LIFAKLEQSWGGDEEFDPSDDIQIIHSMRGIIQYEKELAEDSLRKLGGAIRSRVRWGIFNFLRFNYVVYSKEGFRLADRGFGFAFTVGTKISLGQTFEPSTPTVPTTAQSFLLGFALMLSSW
jgi:hypothetical protein